jgi:hypothetical protein
MLNKESHKYRSHNREPCQTRTDKFEFFVFRRQAPKDIDVKDVITQSKESSFLLVSSSEISMPSIFLIESD